MTFKHKWWKHFWWTDGGFSILDVWVGRFNPARLDSASFQPERPPESAMSTPLCMLWPLECPLQPSAHSWYWINSGISVLCICSQGFAGVVGLHMPLWVCPPETQVIWPLQGAWGPPWILSRFTTATLPRDCSACVHFLRPHLSPSPQVFTGWPFLLLNEEDRKHLTQTWPQLSYPESHIFSLFVPIFPLHFLTFL